MGTENNKISGLQLKRGLHMKLEEAIEKCPEIYQDIIVDGKMVRQGRRLCRERAEMILDVVEDKDSVLDIGANFAYFGHRILSEKKQCTYLGVEREITSCTIAANVLKSYTGGAYVCGNFTYPMLKAIDSTCENVDTLLLMSIIHHFPESKKERRKAHVITQQPLYLAWDSGSVQHVSHGAGGMASLCGFGRRRVRNLCIPFLCLPGVGL